MIAISMILQALLGSALLVVAAMAAFRPTKLSGITPLAPFAALVPAGRGRARLFAALSALAGVATLVGIAVPLLAFFAACLALLVGLIGTACARRAAQPGWLALPLALGCACIGVAMTQPLGLKVLALPNAAKLPYAPVDARVVKTYDEGVWFEGIAAGRDGTLYLAANRHLDFARSDYYRHAEGELIARNANGQERSLFKTPVGATAGVIATGADGVLYMTSHGDAPGVWRIGKEGDASLLVRLPRGAWPNGLAFGPDGKLYASDSSLGLIWRTDPGTGAVEKAIVDQRLSARPFVALAPGANGLHFDGRHLIVTVSDRTTVLDYVLSPDGSFAQPTVRATGIPGDDFAIGPDGSLFITTHPYNTVVKVSPDGERTIVADARQHVSGATDAVFGQGANDRDVLYVVTDGGALSGGPKTRGELIALKPYGNR